MPADDTLDIGQPDTSTLEVFLKMQPLKHTKQLVGVLHVKTHTVVSNKENRFRGCTWLTAHLDNCRIPRPRVFNRVGKEINQHLPQQSRIGSHLRKIVRFPKDVPTT